MRAWVVVALVLAGCQGSSPPVLPDATPEPWTDPVYEIRQLVVTMRDGEVVAHVQATEVGRLGVHPLPDNHSVAWVLFDGAGAIVAENEAGAFTLPGHGGFYIGAELRNASGLAMSRHAEGVAWNPPPQEDSIACTFGSAATHCDGVEVATRPGRSYITVVCDIDDPRDDVAGTVRIRDAEGRTLNAVPTPHPYGADEVECFVAADVDAAGTYLVDWQPETASVGASVTFGMWLEYRVGRHDPMPSAITEWLA